MSKGKGKSGGPRMAMRGGMSEMMKRAYRIQTKLGEIKEQMKAESWTAEAAGGKIKVTITGEKEVSAMEIHKELVNPEDVATLQDALVSAVNAALRLADEKIDAATSDVTGGMKLPGLF
jgi:DNA-binding YbaB/EbfC family protein